LDAAEEAALKVWDVLIEQGQAIRHRNPRNAGARRRAIEAALLLIDIDFNSSKKALIERRNTRPFEMGLARW
jgi:hypothetical protein